jgi:hypothetical protein
MLEGLAPKGKDNICVLMSRAAELSPEDFQILMDAVADPKWSSNGLSVALHERGFKVHKNAVGEHRKKICACVR